MAVSVSNTAYGIIADAMQDAGLLGEGEDPNSEQLSIYLRRLCDVINLWQTQGLKLFLLEEISLDLIAGQNTYTVNPTAGSYPQRHLQVLQGRVETPAGIKRPLNSISWQEWNRLSDTGDSTIVSYFVDKQPTSLIVKFWNTPDTAEALNTAVLLVRTQADNPMNLESNVSFPQEWRIALRWGLADDICTGQPQAIMDRCSQRAQFYRQQLEDWDVEDTTTSFAPDQRLGYGVEGRFR